MATDWYAWGDGDLQGILLASQIELDQLREAFKSCMLNYRFSYDADSQPGEFQKAVPDTDDGSGDPDTIRTGVLLTFKLRKSLATNVALSDDVHDELLEGRRWRGRTNEPEDLAGKIDDVIRKIIYDIDPGAIAKWSGSRGANEVASPTGTSKQLSVGEAQEKVELPRCVFESNMTRMKFMKERRLSWAERCEKEKMMPSTPRYTSDDVQPDQEDMLDGDLTVEPCGAGFHKDLDETGITGQEADAVASEDVAMSGMESSIAQVQQIDSEKCQVPEAMVLSPAIANLPAQHGMTADNIAYGQLTKAPEAVSKPAVFGAVTRAARLDLRNHCSGMTASEHYADLAPEMKSGILDMAEEFAANDDAHRAAHRLVF